MTLISHEAKKLYDEERRKNIKRKRISATSIQASAKAFIAGVDYPNGFSAGDNGIGVRPHKALY